MFKILGKSCWSKSSHHATHMIKRKTKWLMVFYIQVVPTVLICSMLMQAPLVPGWVVMFFCFFYLKYYHSCWNDIILDEMTTFLLNDMVLIAMLLQSQRFKQINYKHIQFLTYKFVLLWLNWLFQYFLIVFFI